ncbi:MAG: hypothetical protein HY352_03035 [Candidatus Omnitrophica bacterium]|nr:hypothetical protein [Candidatus Omnitrophota bacterium]
MMRLLLVSRVRNPFINCGAGGTAEVPFARPQNQRDSRWARTGEGSAVTGPAQGLVANL